MSSCRNIVNDITILEEAINLLTAIFVTLHDV